MSQPNEKPTTDFFEKFIKEYGRAWDNYDLQTILRFYYTPCFIFKSSTVFANVTEEIKSALLSGPAGSLSPTGLCQSRDSAFRSQSIRPGQRTRHGGMGV